MKLSKEEIKAIIPHRDPMLLVDTVEEMEAGDHIVTTFFVDPTREIFKGHFQMCIRDRPISATPCCRERTISRRGCLPLRRRRSCAGRLQLKSGT